METELLNPKIEEKFGTDYGFFVPRAINKAGTFVGEINNMAFCFNGSIFIPEQLNQGNLESRAFDINDNNEIVGMMKRRGQEQSQPLHYHDGKLTELPIPFIEDSEKFSQLIGEGKIKSQEDIPGLEVVETEARLINNSGLIIGTYRLRSDRGGIDRPQICGWKKDEKGQYKPFRIDLTYDLSLKIASMMSRGEDETFVEKMQGRHYDSFEPVSLTNGGVLLFDIQHIGFNGESYPIVWKDTGRDRDIRFLFGDIWKGAPVIESKFYLDDGRVAGVSGPSPASLSWVSAPGFPHLTLSDRDPIYWCAIQGTFGDSYVGTASYREVISGNRHDTHKVIFWPDIESDPQTLDSLYKNNDGFGHSQHVHVAKGNHMVVSGYKPDQGYWRISK